MGRIKFPTLCVNIDDTGHPATPQVTPTLKFWSESILKKQNKTQMAADETDEHRLEKDAVLTKINKENSGIDFSGKHTNTKKDSRAGESSGLQNMSRNKKRRTQYSILFGLVKSQGNRLFVPINKKSRLYLFLPRKQISRFCEYRLGRKQACISSRYDNRKRTPEKRDWKKACSGSDQICRAERNRVASR